MSNISIQDIHITNEAFFQRVQRGDALIRKIAHIANGAEIELTTEHKLLFSMFEDGYKETGDIGNGTYSVGVLGLTVGGRLYPFSDFYKKRINEAIVANLARSATAYDSLSALFSSVNSRWIKRYMALSSPRHIALITESYKKMLEKSTADIYAQSNYTVIDTMQDVLLEMYPVLSDVRASEIALIVSEYKTKCNKINSLCQQEVSSIKKAHDKALSEKKVPIEDEIKRLTAELSKSRKKMNNYVSQRLQQEFDDTFGSQQLSREEALKKAAVKVKVDSDIEKTQSIDLLRKRIADKKAQLTALKERQNAVLETDVKQERIEADKRLRGVENEFNASVQSEYGLDFDVEDFIKKAASRHKRVRAAFLTEQGFLTLEELNVFETMPIRKNTIYASIRQICKKAHVKYFSSVFNDYCLKTANYYGKPAFQNRAYAEKAEAARSALYALVERAVSDCMTIDKFEAVKNNAEEYLSADVLAAIKTESIAEAVSELSAREKEKIKAAKKITKSSLRKIRRNLVIEHMENTLSEDELYQFEETVNLKALEMHMSDAVKENYRKSLMMRKARKLLGSAVLADIYSRVEALGLNGRTSSDGCLGDICELIYKEAVANDVVKGALRDIEISRYLKSLITIMPATLYDKLLCDISDENLRKRYAGVFEDLESFEATFKNYNKHILANYKKGVSVWNSPRKTASARIEEITSKLISERDKAIKNDVPKKVARELEQITGSLAQLFTADKTVTAVFVLPTGVLLRHKDESYVTHAVSPVDTMITGVIAEEQRDLWCALWEDYLKNGLKEYDSFVKKAISDEIALIIENHTGNVEEWETVWFNLQEKSGFTLCDGMLDAKTGSLSQSVSSYDIELLEQIASCFSGIPISISLRDFSLASTLANYKTSVNNYLSGSGICDNGLININASRFKLNLSVLRQLSDNNDIREIGSVLTAIFASLLYQRITHERREKFTFLMGDKARVSKQSFYQMFNRKVESAVERSKLLCRTLFVMEYGKYTQNKSSDEITLFFDEIKSLFAY